MWMMLVFTVNSLLNFVVSLLVAKFLGPAEYGRFVLALSASVVIQLLLNDHGGRKRQHEAAIFGGAQKLRDQQADHEIQQAVHCKDKHHPHAERDSRDAMRGERRARPSWRAPCPSII